MWSKYLLVFHPFVFNWIIVQWKPMTWSLLVVWLLLDKVVCCEERKCAGNNNVCSEELKCAVKGGMCVIKQLEVAVRGGVFHDPCGPAYLLFRTYYSVECQAKSLSNSFFTLPYFQFSWLFWSSTRLIDSSTYIVCSTVLSGTKTARWPLSRAQNSTFLP